MIQTTSYGHQMFPLLLLELRAEELILDVKNLLIQRVKTLEYNDVF
jgi:hypothetical protein